MPDRTQTQSRANAKREPRDRENGRTFASAAELADQLVALLSGFPRAAELASLRRGVGEMARWEENWTALAAPVFDALGRRS